MRTVAIIGGGLSGTLAAANLLCDDHMSSVRVVLIERGGRVGPGVAYATDSPRHFLNLPCGSMSGFFDMPGHFCEWARAIDARVGPRSILPRWMYGAYLEWVLREASRRSSGRLELVGGDVVGVERRDGRHVLAIEGGGDIGADAVVLALGNFPPRAPAEISNIGESGRYIGNPWAPGALRGVDPDVPVIFLGAGLTMADCAVELSALGHRGPMTAWSRGGLLARGRSDSEMAEERVGSMRDTRVASPGFVRVPEMRGTAWLDRARLGAIGAGEEATYRLWKSLPARARRSILKRIAPPVKRVRHRIPPRTYAVLLSLIERGQLRVRAGELAAFTEGALGLEADFRANPSGKRVRIEAALIVNCTGPERDVTRLPDALVRGLVRSGAARPDAVRSGFDCTAGGNVIDRNGERTPGLFAIGPLRSGGPWTADAVPGIRVQAARLGAALRRDGVR